MSVPPPLAALCVALLSGCATSGPNHLYAASAGQPGVVNDFGPEGRVEVPSFIGPGEQLTGLAYDPFTDHLFLRLLPGNKIRVIDRPARKVKREFVINALPATGGGDLAVRPRDGHIFFTHPTAPVLIETTRLGEFIRQIPLAQVRQPVVGVAFDAVHQRLLLLSGSDFPVLGIHDLNGKQLGEIPLASVGARGPLAYDSVRGEIYAPGAREGVIVVFNAGGQVLRRLPGLPAAFLDAGPRPFLRVF